jgi:transglutaminase-like putative cysteine protease
MRLMDSVFQIGSFVVLFGFILLITWLFSIKGNSSRNVITSLSFYIAVSISLFFFAANEGEGLMSFWVMLGAMALCIGIMVWAFEWQVDRLRSVLAHKRNDSSWFMLIGFSALLSVLIAFLFVRPLPLIGTQFVNLGQSVKNTLPSVSEITNRIKNTTQVGNGEPQQATVSGAGFDNRRELPKKGSINLGNQEVMYLKIPDDGEFNKFIAQQNYVRNAVLDKYADDAWESVSMEKEWRSDEMDGTKDDWVRLAEGNGISHEIFLPVSGGAGLPAIQNPLAYRLKFIIGSGFNSYQAELRGAVRYQVESRPLVWSEFRGDPQRISQGISPDLLSPAKGNLGRKVKSLFSEITEGLIAGPEKLDSIQRYLRSEFEYSTEVKNLKSLSAMENFLFQERAGWCDYFASAAALLAREAGYPARTAYGFSGGRAFPKEGIVSYDASDAHSWAEVLVEGHGWVVFDATPVGAGAADLPTRSSIKDVKGPELSSYKDAHENESNVEIAKDPEEDKRTQLIWLAGLLGLFALFYLKVFIQSFIRKTKESEPAGPSERELYLDRDAPPYLLEFLKMCLELGRPKAKGDTIREAIQEVRNMKESGSEVFDLLADYHYAVRYAGSTRNRATETVLKKSFRRLRKGRGVSL